MPSPLRVVLRLVILAMAAASALSAQPSIWGGDYQTSSVDYVAFPQQLQVRTSVCIDQPCGQYSVTFTSPDSRLAVFCPSSPCTPTTSITVQNPTNSEIASVTLYVGTLAASYLISATTRGTTLYFHEMNTAGNATYVNPTAGTPQSVRTGSVYTSLQATVTDAYGNPNGGALVTFTAPPGVVRGFASPTAFFPGPTLSATAYTDTNGNATSPYLTANAIGGSFTVSAAVSGISGTASFSLTNLIDVTVGTSPSGRSFTVDGAPYSAGQVFYWAPGSSHAISTTSPQSAGAGTQYAWTSWSDGGAISHTITASAGAAYTANFVTQYLLTTSASPSNGGTVGPASGFYNAGQTVGLSATANPAFSFSVWTGSGSGSYSGTNPAGTVTMSGPIVETATFSATGTVTVQTNPAGRSFTVDGTPYTTTQAFTWTTGSTHTIATTSPQAGSTGTQHTWTSWSDGGAISHTITASSGAVFTANFSTQYLLTTAASPSSGGTVGPASGYYSSGQTVALSATSNSGFSFANWTGSGSGSYTGTNPGGAVVMNGPITETAAFTPTGTVTVQTSPSGRSFTVDGINYATTQVFTWATGSTHTIATTSPQAGPSGTQYAWASWSDSGGISHSITASAGSVYTANFTTQYLLTTSASPPNGGSAGPPSGYYNAGQTVTLSATPNPAFSFAGWNGTGSGSYTGTNPGGAVVMNSPITETATFAAVGSVTVQTNPPGRSFVVDGTTYTTTQVFNWTAGTIHTLATSTPQSVTGTQYAWSGWSDNGSISHSITAGSGAVYTANFETKHHLGLNVSPADGGTLSASPAAADGFYASGTAVQLTALANSGFEFSGFTGLLSGNSNPQGLTITSPGEITANFARIGSGGACDVSADVLQGAITILPSGGSGAIMVTADQACSWSASSDQPWMTIASGASGTGPGMVQWSASANGIPGKRSAILIIRSRNSVTQSFSQVGNTNVALALASTLFVAPPGSGSRAPVQAAAGASAVAIPLRLSGDASDTPIAAGSPVRFSATVTNRGKGTASTTFSGTVDSYVSIQSCTVSTGGSCTMNGNSASATVGSLGSGQSSTVDLSGVVKTTLPNGTTLTTTLRAASTEDNSTPEDSLATAAMVGVDPSTPAYALALDLAPIGGGSIAANPVSGTGRYLANTHVALSAIPAPGYQFTGWSGDLTGTLNPRTVTMSAARSVKANFAPLAGGGLRFVPLPPCRILDTRNAVGPYGGPALAGGGTRDFPVTASDCHVPGTALAYSLNVTAVPSGGLGYLTIWPTGQSQPTVSTLNSDGRVKANAAIVPAGTGGSIQAYATDSTHLVVDINGYFAPTSATDANALAFYLVRPCRIADTRNSPGTYGGPSFGAGTTRTFPIAGAVCDVPANAKALSLNMTAVPNGFLGYMTVWPSGRSRPLVSTLNAPLGNILANAAMVPVGDDGGISVYMTDRSEVVIDINGYFAPPGSGGLSFYPAAPCRIADSREAWPTPFGVPRLTAGEVRTYPIPQSACATPSSAQAWVLNATVVPSGGLGYLTLFPGGTAQPFVSTLNAGDGTITSNAAVVPAGTNGRMSVFVTNQTEFLFDISGYFAP